MPGKFTVACVQNCAEDDVAANIEDAVRFVREAAAAGADLICLPENFSCLEERDELYASRGYREAEHPALAVFPALARELGVHLALGSLTIRLDSGRVHNRSYLVDSSGDVRATYNKIHLFDVQLRGGEMYRESATVEPGTGCTLVDLPWGRLGLSICYDVRFPHLYRRLAQQGADFLGIPAAFTATTGEAHWHVLVRARAIETGCYVFAAGQCGRRRWGRRTYGHSLIVDPWGVVLADAGNEPGFVLAEVDPAKVAEARAMIPALQHDRPLG
jgi:predicted amidohydrolase